MLEEFGGVRSLKLPIWKKTSLFVSPKAPLFVAERVTGDAGQNQGELVVVHIGSWPNDGGVKNSPFEPLSTMVP
jgi:hypothetical protein